MPVQTSWMDQANCKGADPELFFPERGSNQDTYVQRMYCNSCPVKAECFSYAMEYEMANGGFHHYGVYGGVGGARRKALTRHFRSLPETPVRG